MKRLIFLLLIFVTGCWRYVPDPIIIIDNPAYGSMTFHNDSETGITTPILAKDVYFNITGFNSSTGTQQQLKLFNYSNPREELIVLISGVYDLFFSVSTGNAGNNQEYNFGISINETPFDFVETHRKIGAAGDVGSSSNGWIINFTKGDRIKMIVVNVDGTADLLVHKATLKIIQLS